MTLQPPSAEVTSEPEARREDDDPYEWIVNSNALGVIFIERDEADFRIAFASRHARRRLADGRLLGATADELVGSPPTALAVIDELSPGRLADRDAYPTTIITTVQGRDMEFAISPVISGDDDYLGLMTTFNDVTAKTDQEREAVAFRRRMTEHTGEAAAQADATQTAADLLKEAVEEIVRNRGVSALALLGELQKLSSATRILALNATIGANRGSDSGSVFAVIAGELQSWRPRPPRSAAMWNGPYS